MEILYSKEGARSENLGGQVVIWRAAAAWECLQFFQNLVGVCVRTGSLWVKYSRPPDHKSTSNVSLPFAWITGARKHTQLGFTLSINYLNNPNASYKKKMDGPLYFSAIDRLLDASCWFTQWCTKSWPPSRQFCTVWNLVEFSFPIFSISFNYFWHSYS